MLRNPIWVKSPHQRGISGLIGKKFGNSWGGIDLLAILAVVGILKHVAFEFVSGVRRGLNGNRG